MNCIAKFDGIVVKGNMIGRTLSFPTANIDVDEPNDVKFGAYLSIVTIRKVKYLAISNYGIHPTYEATVKPLLESYIFNFHKLIYGKKITVELVEFLRPERKFDSLDDLKDCLLLDKVSALNLYFLKYKDLNAKNI